MGSHPEKRDDADEDAGNAFLDRFVETQMVSNYRAAEAERERAPARGPVGSIPRKTAKTFLSKPSSNGTF